MQNGFKDLKVTRQFIDALEGMGITEPTEIQEKGIPPAISGQDVLGIAQTGSGKTLAFLLPLVMKIKQAGDGRPQALIMAPAKELALQIFDVLNALTVNTNIRSVCLYGGVGKTAQAKELEAGCEIIVATPGRFLDLYSLGYVELKTVRTLVLDEADRLMEMGFLRQFKSLLEVIPTKRQNLLFSATFPERVKYMADEFLEFPTRVEGTLKEKPVEKLDQRWMRVENFRSKLNLLLHLFEKEEWNRVIVFCRTKDSATRVSAFLSRKEIGDVRVLHANKAQNTRINAMEDFRKGEVRVLVTTDVTSRGIDVANVSHVVNFEVPKVPEDYLHRVGRTARIHKEGIALTLANKAEEFLIKKIEKFLGEVIPLEPWPVEVEIGEELPGEAKAIARELDGFKQKADPNFKGAFHQRQKGKKKKKKR
ncbi:MAG TPA: DEAD/DEAH box helicase [Cryomorphaceae bacterium]|nr:DEAD/DEAH box helicase [Cryomorphaceae bacterium]